MTKELSADDILDKIDKGKTIVTPQMRKKVLEEYPLEPVAFDWFKAVRLINQLNPQKAKVRCLGDEAYTAVCTLVKNGEMLDQYPNTTDMVFVAPGCLYVLVMNGTVHDCWILSREQPGWTKKTYFPRRALEQDSKVISLL